MDIEVKAMASMEYSAPPTLERQKTRTQSKSWLVSAKEIFFKPWRHSQKKQRNYKAARHPNKAIQETSPNETNSLINFSSAYPNNPFQHGLINFHSRPSPEGMPQPHKNKQDKGNEREPEISENPTRPPLSNIFPMYNSPKVTPVTFGKPLQQMTNGKPLQLMTNEKSLQQMTNEKPLQLMTNEKSLLQIVTNEEPPKQHVRRHSTPATPSDLLKLPSNHENRRSSASSDITPGNPRQGRQERRASIQRDLPLLPKRGQDPFKHNTNSSSTTPIDSPAVYPHSEYSGFYHASNQFVADHMNSDHQVSITFEPLHSPPTGPGGQQSNFAYHPQWSNTHEQLKELEEELEDEEADGEEGRVMIDEVDGEILELTPYHEDSWKRKATTGGFKKTFLNKIASKGIEPLKNKHQDGKVKNKHLVKDNPNEIRGFDNFFLY